MGEYASVFLGAFVFGILPGFAVGGVVLVFAVVLQIFRTASGLWSVSGGGGESDG